MPKPSKVPIGGISVEHPLQAIIYAYKTGKMKLLVPFELSVVTMQGVEPEKPTPNGWNHLISGSTNTQPGVRYPPTNTYPQTPTYPPTNSYPPTNLYPQTNRYPPINSYAPTNNYPQTNTYLPTNTYPSTYQPSSSYPNYNSPSYQYPYQQSPTYDDYYSNYYNQPSYRGSNIQPAQTKPFPQYKALQQVGKYNFSI